MSTMCGCPNCEGEKVSSNCLVWEGKSYEFKSFNELVEYVVDNLKSLKSEHKIDLKVLSDESLSRDEVIQLLVDKTIVFSKQTNSSTASKQFDCSLNVSSIDNCSNCTKTLCEKLQLMADTIARQQTEINQLKENLFG
jgi:hypothetical protein